MGNFIIITRDSKTESFEMNLNGNRDAVIRVRLTKLEKAAILSLAKDAGMTLSEYVRGCCLKTGTK